MDRKKEQIQERREFGKARLCRRDRADSVIRLERKMFANRAISVCAAPSHVCFVKTPDLKRLCFYKESSGYFIFFPASGNRNYNDGKLYNSGASGYGWTSTPNGSNAWNLDVWSTNAHMNNNNRGNGFPVRCVQVSAPVFVFAKDTFVFFPASGFRAPSDGKLDNSDSVGYFWVSTTAGGGYAYSLYAPSGTVRVANHVCNDGFSVRCVQVSVAVWAVQKENIKQIRYRRESGKEHLCRRGQADSVTRLGRKLSVGHSFLPCAAPSYLFTLIKLPVFDCLYFYKYSSGYSLFFPAAGIRNYNDGSLRNSGGEGDGWTSTPYNSENAYRFILNSGNANMSNTNRTYGFPVRCVQASAAVFAFSNDTFVFFPAAGIRNNTDGSLTNSGIEGDGWTSVPDGNNAFRLIFKSGYAYVTSVTRMYGFPVRCVQASAAVFAFIKETFVFFPATGYRHYSNGGFYNSGTWGYWWTSTPGNDGKAWRLHVQPGTSQMVADWCSYGFPVRCVQASAAVFIFTKDTFVFFPASGLRGNGDGKLGWSGSWGGCWTSTLNGSGIAWLLAFSPASVYLGPDNGGLGLPVRCVQASAAVFVFIIKDFKETPVFFFPASGFRNYSDGGLLTSGTGGFGWTSTLFGGDVWYFECRSSDARLFAGPHGYGFPVRCVQASAAVFVFIKETFVFFPAAGHRNHGDGNLRASDMNGYAWSSTLSGGKAYNLTFNSGGANLHLNENRGHGFPVRCVQASATVWAVQKENIKQIRYRRESGKACPCRRGQADSVTRLGRKLSVGHSFLPCAVPSYSISLIKLPVLNGFYFYKYSSGYFLFFPASGYRHYNNGSLSSAGTEGFGWTSLSNGVNAFFLRILSGVAHVREAPRTYGFPVRCVQASAAVFVFGNYLQDRKKTA